MRPRTAIRLGPLLACSALLAGCGPASVGDDATGGGTAEGGTSDGGLADGGTLDGGATDGGGADGGTADGGTADGGTADGGTDTTAPDFRDAGPYVPSLTTGSTDVGGGCTLSWTAFRPQDQTPTATVLLAHGYLRSQANHTDLATHLASWGLQAVTMDLCHSSLLDVDHEQNGLDLVALRGTVAEGPVVYAGHSAGGLAALVAGAADPDAAAVLALDPVDVGDLGLSAAASITGEVRALFGEPGLCNSDGNGVDVVQAAPLHRELRLTDADHCDFEGPTDVLCTGLCSGGNDSFSDDEIAATTHALATAAVLATAAGDATADQWWDPGAAWGAALLASGAVTEP